MAPGPRKNADILDSAGAVVSVLDAERDREIMRQDTLARLKDQPQEHAEMVAIFEKERAEADKLIRKLLEGYKRPPPRQLAVATSVPRTGKGRGERRDRTSGGTAAGGQRHHPLLAASQPVSSPIRSPPIKNRLPGSSLEVAPVNVPSDGLLTPTVKLDYVPAVDGAGNALEPTISELVGDHTHHVDLTFPELQKYDKPAQEFAKWKEQT